MLENGGRVMINRNCVLIFVVCCDGITFTHKNTGTLFFFPLPLGFTLHFYIYSILMRKFSQNQKSILCSKLDNDHSHIRGPKEVRY